MAATLTAARNLRSETFTESPGVFNFGSAGKPRPQVGLALHHLLPCVELVGIVGRRPEADLRPLPGQMSRALLCRHPITTGAGGKAVHALLSGRRRLNSSIQTVVRPAGVWPSMQAPSRLTTSAPRQNKSLAEPGCRSARAPTGAADLPIFRSVSSILEFPPSPSHGTQRSSWLLCRDHMEERHVDELVVMHQRRAGKARPVVSTVRSMAD